MLSLSQSEPSGQITLAHPMASEESNNEELNKTPQHSKTKLISRTKMNQI